MDLDQKLAGLSDQQALSIVASLAGEFSDENTPQGQQQQAAGLQAVFCEVNPNVKLEFEGVSTEAAAGAARALLRMMAQVPEMSESLIPRLENPPTQEHAAVPLVLAAPVVLTGCIVLLQVAGHLRFSYESGGKLKVAYDPGKKTPLDANLRGIVSHLVSVMGKFIPAPGGRAAGG